MTTTRPILSATSSCASLSTVASDMDIDSDVHKPHPKWANPYPTPPSSFASRSASSVNLSECTSPHDDIADSHSTSSFSSSYSSRPQPPQLPLASFPHIADAILEFAPPASLLVLRATCRHLRDRADTLLSHHVVLSTTAPTAAHTHHPSAGYTPCPRIQGNHVRILDVRDCLPPPHNAPASARSAQPGPSTSGANPNPPRVTEARCPCSSTTPHSAVHVASSVPSMPHLHTVRLHTVCTQLAHVPFPAPRGVCTHIMSPEEGRRYLVLPTAVANVPRCTVNVGFSSPFAVFPSNKSYPSALEHVILRLCGEENGVRAEDKAGWASLPLQLGGALAQAAVQGVRFTVVGVDEMAPVLGPEPHMALLRCVVDELADRFGWHQERIDELPHWLEFVSKRQYEESIGAEMAALEACA